MVTFQTSVFAVCLLMMILRKKIVIRKKKSSLSTEDNNSISVNQNELDTAKVKREYIMKLILCLSHHNLQPVYDGATVDELSKVKSCNRFYIKLATYPGATIRCDCHSSGFTKIIYTNNSKILYVDDCALIEKALEELRLIKFQTSK